jgi:hypothetical protein
VVALAVHVILWLLTHLLSLLLPVAIPIVLMRMLAAPILRGHGGVGAEFLFRVFLWPFQIARAVLRGAGREWRHSRYRHVKIKGHRRRPLLAPLAQRIARRTRHVGGPLFATDDGGPYPRDDFDVVWQEHLRKLRRQSGGNR